MSLFLLSQVFLIIHYPPLVRQLADIIFNGDLSVCSAEFTTSLDPASRSLGALAATRREFAAPEEPLAQSLDNNRTRGASPGHSDTSESPSNSADATPKTTTSSREEGDDTETASSESKKASNEALVCDLGINQQTGGMPSVNSSSSNEGDDGKKGGGVAGSWPPKLSMPKPGVIEAEVVPSDGQISPRQARHSREKSDLEKRWGFFESDCEASDDERLEGVADLYREEEEEGVGELAAAWLHMDGRQHRGLAVRVPSRLGSDRRSTAAFETRDAAWLHRTHRQTRGFAVRVPSRLEERLGPAAAVTAAAAAAAEEMPVRRRLAARRVARVWRVMSGVK